MKKNIGKLDKIIRLIIAAILIILSLAGVISGALNVIALVLALVLIGTSFTGMCGLYSLLGIRTCPVEDASTDTSDEAFDDIPETSFDEEVPTHETREASLDDMDAEDHAESSDDEIAQ